MIPIVVVKKNPWSNMLKFSNLIILVLVTNTILLSHFSVAKNEHENKSSSKRGIYGKMLSFLDWNSYMRLFNKKYSSPVQELAHQKMFMTRVMEVFITGIKYKMFQLSYFTAINKYSDLTLDQSKRMLSGDYSSFTTADVTDDNVARKILLEVLKDKYAVSEKSIEEELHRERAKIFLDKKIRRIKRSVSDHSRKLNAADLIRVDDKTVLPSNQQLNIKWIVPPNNPNYESLVGYNWNQSSLNRNQGNHTSIERVATPEDKINKIEQERKWTIVKDHKPTAIEDNVETIVIRDWRQSNCISLARDQGYCASCYAMSSIGFMEWAFCESQGDVLTPLSVQYMVSCGKQFSSETNGKIKLYGCTHGISKQTVDFIKEYGLELEANMPYIENESECPIAHNTERKKKGYIRPNVKPAIRLNNTSKQLDLALKVSPIIVSMREPKSFLAYAGGIIEHCESHGGHAMLVIGNMIEDGEEYLLIKNSFGPYWGYEGNFKFRRSSIKECVKEFIIPIVSFPGKKAQARRIRAYLADHQGEPTIDEEDIDIANSELGEMLSE